MKKALLILVILALAIPSMAQETKPMFFVGGYYTDGLSMTSGTTIGLGGQFYGLTYAQVGDYGGDVNAEVMYVFSFNKLWMAPIFGGDFEIINPDDAPSLEKFLLATGVAGGYWISDNLGVWAGAKWKSDLQANEEHSDTWSFGLGLAFDIY